MKVVEMFDTETTNSTKMQSEGWQATLNNFARFVERNR